MATKRDKLEKLHEMITESYLSRITQDLVDNIPTDAATLSGAVKFLKDNDVTADPASADDLADLRAKLTAARAPKLAKAASTLDLAKGDMQNMLDE